MTIYKLSVTEQGIVLLPFLFITASKL